MTTAVFIFFAIGLASAVVLAVLSGERRRLRDRPAAAHAQPVAIRAKRPRRRPF